jgi:polyhydroxybutyrate depolymerase
MRRHRLVLTLWLLCACNSGITTPAAPDQAQASAQADGVAVAPSKPVAPAPSAAPAPSTPPSKAKPQSQPEPQKPVAKSCEGKAGRAGDSVVELEVNGVTRSTRLHVPAGYDPKRLAMLVLTFHGSGSDAEGAEYVSKMTASSDRQGFIVAYPNGIDGDWSCCGNAGSEDVTFVEALIDRLASQYCVDAARVFAAGFSNGGYMAYRLMCQLSSKIAAIASVEGALGVRDCTPERPISVIAFNGTEDDPVPYREGLDTNERIRALNHCSGQPVVAYAKGEVTCQLWEACDADSEVELCSIEGGGHQWAGGNAIDGLGHITTDVDATAVMIAFFGTK